MSAEMTGLESRNPLESVLAALPNAESKLARPVYHVHSPANWMNDPNGPVYYKGWYHIFYQFNPFGDVWGNMHWGHARSRDLVSWEHLPIALGPDENYSEEGVWSGSIVFDPDGRPMLFYTSIKNDRTPREYAEQMVAVPLDDDLIRWKRHSANPIMTPEIHNGLQVYEWRDPAFFSVAGRQFCVLAGNIQKPDGKHRGVVTLYEATTPDLLNWKYCGILFEHPDPNVHNIEVPCFFQVGGKFILTITPPAVNEYYVGDFNLESLTFKVETSSALDVSRNFFAPNVFLDSQGRRIMWAWVRGFDEGEGWNGVLALPRELRLCADGKLSMAPVAELSALRRNSRSFGRMVVDGAETFRGIASANQELLLEYDAPDDARIELATRDLSIVVDHPRKELLVGGTIYKFGAEERSSAMRLHVFVDRSVVEVYLNYRTIATRIINPVSPGGMIDLRISSPYGPIALDRLDVWELDAIFHGDVRQQLMPKE
ncbi:glycoside hydrolase family 32 protein [bacterium]|nr:glycoside hydrolase family 32 protein [bacterium]